MSNLNATAANSLSAVNQWIGLINSNITGTRKVGYKETRVSLTLGSPDNIGVQSGTSNISMIIPSASLSVQRTEILDYLQGNLYQTQNHTDFALNGKGYFVVEDKAGNRYATRDGTFRFDNDGYLVTEEGLRVLTTGQDYVRIPASETFTVDQYGKTVGVGGTDRRFQINNAADPTGTIFNPAGALVGSIPPLVTPAGVRSYSISKYGFKRLMVVDVIDSYKLHYSKYGSTKFDLGDYIPLRMDNSFSEDISILNLSESDLVSPFTNKAVTTGTGGFGFGGTGLGTSIIGVNGGENRDYFKHDQTNGVVRYSQRDSVYSKVLLTGHRLANFQASADISLRRDNAAQNIQSFGFYFGQKEKYQVAQDVQAGQTTEVISFNSQTGTADHYNGAPPPAESSTVKNVNMLSGFWGGIYHAGGGNYQLMIQGDGLVKTVNIPGGFNFDALNSTATANNYNISLKASGDVVSVTLTDGSNNTIISLSANINRDLYQNGYVAIGNGARPGNSSDAAVDISRVHLHEIDNNNYFDTRIYGGEEPYRQSPATNGATPPNGVIVPPGTIDQLETLGQASKLGTTIEQGYLEESTSSITDSLPLLSNVQKIFSAISKIITVNNSQQDDLNGLLR